MDTCGANTGRTGVGARAAISRAVAHIRFGLSSRARYITEDLRAVGNTPESIRDASAMLKLPQIKFQELCSCVEEHVGVAYFMNRCRIFHESIEKTR